VDNLDDKKAAGPDAMSGAPSPERRCGNCDTILTGPYCANCGQHAHSSARHLHLVVHDAWHDLTHIDGRLWHTLAILLVRPGRLTIDYFDEKRSRYLPPVRLYLVLSVLFFSLSGSVGSGLHGESRIVAPKDLQREISRETDPEEREALKQAQARLESLRPGSAGASCDSIRLPRFARVEQAARDACKRIVADEGRSFLSILAHNVPRMMFVFLPLVAAVMRLLYLRPRRYYVEHLVLLLHNHSALFLVFSLINLVGLLGNLWSPAMTLSSGLAKLAVCAYMPWYLFTAMRKYYVQGRLLTLAKFSALVSVYFVFLLTTLICTAVITALEMPL
jgi:hypothetical protein